MNLMKTFSLLLIASSLTLGQTKQWLNFYSESEIVSQAFEGQYDWIVTKDYLVRLDMLTGEKQYFLFGVGITSIAVDEKGNKWIGTYSRGLIKYDGQCWTEYNTSNSGLPHNYAQNVLPDKKGNIWIPSW
ncbi:MAG: hypothetical protein ACM34K_13690, partial [Bacillota bacterium]